MLDSLKDTLLLMRSKTHGKWRDLIFDPAKIDGALLEALGAFKNATLIAYRIAVKKSEMETFIDFFMEAGWGMRWVASNVCVLDVAGISVVIEGVPVPDLGAKLPSLGCVFCFKDERMEVYKGLKSSLSTFFKPLYGENLLGWPQISGLAYAFVVGGASCSIDFFNVSSPDWNPIQLVDDQTEIRNPEGE